MKKAIVAAWLLLFANSLWAEVLLEAVCLPGYELRPQKRVLTLDSSGKINVAITNLQRGTTVRMNKGQFAPVMMNEIRREIRPIRPHIPLIDITGKEPECADAPSYSVYVYINGA